MLSSATIKFNGKLNRVNESWYSVQSADSPALGPSTVTAFSLLQRELPSLCALELRKSMRRRHLLMSLRDAPSLHHSLGIWSSR